jgi:hypothetical protein
MAVQQSFFDLLSDGVLLHILVLLCASAPPQTPGICWVTCVCKRWQQLAGKCRGLRVLFDGQASYLVSSFEVWISRHAPQVGVLLLSIRMTGGPVYCGSLQAWHPWVTAILPLLASTTQQSPVSPAGPGLLYCTDGRTSPQSQKA